MFVNDVAELFSSFGTEEQQEVLCWELDALGAEETARQFRQAERILDGYIRAAGNISVPLYVALCEAKSRAKEAKERAEAYATR